MKRPNEYENSELQISNSMSQRRLLIFNGARASPEIKVIQQKQQQNVSYFEV